MSLRNLCSVAAATAALFWVSAATAGPDVAGTVIIDEPNGIGGICAAPCYRIEKAFEVYLDGNPTTPAGPNCPAGDNTYLYTLTHIGGSSFPFPVISFELEVPVMPSSSRMWPPTSTGFEKSLCAWTARRCSRPTL